jgi:hypothetical protein
MIFVVLSGFVYYQSAISITAKIYLPPNISTLGPSEIGFDPD